MILDRIIALTPTQKNLAFVFENPEQLGYWYQQLNPIQRQRIDVVSVDDAAVGFDSRILPEDHTLVNSA